MSLFSSMYIYAFIIHPPGFCPWGWLGKNTRQIWIELCGFVDQGVVICVWLPLPTSALQKHVLLILQCFYICVWNLCVFLTLSPSLHPSLHDSLYLNIPLSMYMCLSVGWKCVFGSDNKRATVQVQGNSWYQRVEPLSLSLSLYPSLPLSLIFCLSLSPLSIFLSFDCKTPR